MAVYCIEDKIGQLVTGCKMNCTVTGFEKYMWECTCEGCIRKPEAWIIIGVLALVVTLGSYIIEKWIRERMKKTNEIQNNPEEHN